MLTVVIKRNAEPNVIQLTEENVMRELSSMHGAEMLLEDSWTQGLKKVRTPYVCLVEADCVLSSSYLSSNLGLMHKTKLTEAGKGGGFTKLAMISSCLGINTFANRIYNYRFTKETVLKDHKYDIEMIDYQLTPNRNKLSMELYQIQVGFVPGAIIRMASIHNDIDSLPWDDKDLTKLSSDISLHFWETGRRIQVNPNTTYVSTQSYLEEPKQRNWNIPTGAGNLFMKEGIS